MITIRCSRCKSKIIRYRKVGKGRVLRCFKDRIAKRYKVQEAKDLVCECGQMIGTDEGKWFKMDQNAFEYSGTVTRK